MLELKQVFDRTPNKLMLAKKMLTDPKVKFAVKMLYGKSVPDMVNTMMNTARNRGVSEEEIQSVFNHFGIDLDSAYGGKGLQNIDKR